MVIGYRHTGIVVDDIELQLKFYRDILELDVYYDQYEDGSWLSKILPMQPDSHARIIKLGKNNLVMVELLAFKEWTYKELVVKAYNEVGITHLAFQVVKLDEMYEKMVNSKVSFVNPPTQNPDKTAKVCFCYDFEGNLIELVEILSI